MSASRACAALLGALLAAPLAARGETWDPVEIAEAEKLRVAEAERAAAYRARVARGDVRGARAPMPREAPQRPQRAPGDALRGAADLVDFIERLFGGSAGAGRREGRGSERER